jgi:hypothetical protein
MFGTLKLVMSVLAAVSSSVMGCQTSTASDAAVDPEIIESTVLKTREDVRVTFPVAKCPDYELDGARYMFCANDLPSDGCSIIEIRGWIFRDHSRLWKSVFMVQLNAVGGIEIFVDPKTQLFSANRNAINAFLNQPLRTFDLRPTVLYGKSRVDPDCDFNDTMSCDLEARASSPVLPGGDKSKTTGAVLPDAVCFWVDFVGLIRLF